MYCMARSVITALHTQHSTHHKHPQSPAHTLTLHQHLTPCYPVIPPPAHCTHTLEHLATHTSTHLTPTPAHLTTHTSTPHSTGGRVYDIDSRVRRKRRIGRRGKGKPNVPSYILYLLPHTPTGDREHLSTLPALDTPTHL